MVAKGQKTPECMVGFAVYQPANITNEDGKDGRWGDHGINPAGQATLRWGMTLSECLERRPAKLKK